MKYTLCMNWPPNYFTLLYSRVFKFSQFPKYGSTLISFILTPSMTPEARIFSMVVMSVRPPWARPEPFEFWNISLKPFDQWDISKLLYSVVSAFHSPELHLWVFKYYYIRSLFWHRRHLGWAWFKQKDPRHLSHMLMWPLDLQLILKDWVGTFFRPGWFYRAWLWGGFLLVSSWANQRHYLHRQFVC